MEHEPRTCSCWYMNETHRRGIGSKFGTLRDGPRTEEEAKGGVKVWENGWAGVSPEVYGDYWRRMEEPDVGCSILASGASAARLAVLMVPGFVKKAVVHLLRQVPSLTGVVEVDDEETHVSLEGADLVALTRFVCRFHRRFHECIAYLPHLPAELAAELCLFPTHGPSLLVGPLDLLTPAPFVFVMLRPPRPPFVVDGVPRLSYWDRSRMNLVLGELRRQGEAGIVVAILEAKWLSHWENVETHCFDNEVPYC
jgi:hypothetical protein